MQNIPKTIYLQIGDECPDDEDFNKLYGVSWCVDKIYENDIEYVLKSRIEEAINNLENVKSKYLKMYTQDVINILKKL